jgi:hypothetical protein
MTHLEDLSAEERKLLEEIRQQYDVKFVFELPMSDGALEVRVGRLGQILILCRQFGYQGGFDDLVDWLTKELQTLDRIRLSEIRGGSDGDSLL